MSNKNTNSPDLTALSQDKFKIFSTQKQTIFEYLKEHTATASMITEATGIPQKSICRYKRDFEKIGLLYEIAKKHCKVTGFRAWYLTTNQDKMPKPDQLTLNF